MKFAMTKIAALALMSVASTAALAIPVTSISVTGGTFQMPGFSGIIPYANFGTGSTNTVGYHNGSGGASVANTAFDPAGTVGFYFGAGVPGSTQKTVNTYTAATNMGDLGSAAGTIPGGPAVTGNATSFTNGATFNVDMSSFFANYNGTDFNQGSGKNAVGVADGSFATGTLSGCAGNTCNYSIGWSSYIVGGPFDGNTGIWTMTGTTVAAVPEASTYGMMLAGLGLVGGMVARRRKILG